MANNFFKVKNGISLPTLAADPTTNPPANSETGDAAFYNNELYIKTAAAWEKVIAGQAESTEIKDSAVTTAKIANGAVTTDKITDLNVTTTKIANSAVTTDKITNSAVTTAKIADSNVTTAKIADANVTTVKIADANVTTAKIADSNVTTVKIANSAVTVDKIADSAVTTAKISNSNVTTDKIADLNVTTGKIANSAVTDVKLATNAVTADKIASNAVTDVKINSGAVTNAKLATSAVTDTKIASSAVTNAKLASNAVTDVKVDANAAIAGTKISPNFGAQNVLTTGNVGIGTVSPEYKIDVTAVNNVTTTTAFAVQNSSRNYGLGLGAYTLTNRNIGGSATNIDYTFDIGGASIFKTAGQERMRIDANGFTTFYGYARIESPFQTATALQPSQTIDCSLKNIELKIGGTTSTITLSNFAEGQTFVLVVLGNGSPYTLSWTDVKWPSAVVPIPTSTINRFDVYSFIKIGGFIFGSVTKDLG